MGLLPSQILTAQFKHWEHRHRGWYVFDIPVHLEPLHFAFLSHGEPLEYADYRKPPPECSQEMPDDDDMVFAIPYMVEDPPVLALAITFPKGHRISAAETEQFLIMLANCNEPVSFELIATSEQITVQYMCHETDRSFVKQQLKAYFPACSISEQKDALLQILAEEWAMVDFGLDQEFMRPVAQASSFDPDPYTSLFGVLENLDVETGAAVQILFRGCRNHWEGSIINSVTHQDGNSFFRDTPEMPQLAKQKVAAPLFAVVIRVIGTAETEETAEDICAGLGAAIMHFSRSQTNSLIPLFNDNYDSVDHYGDILLRQSRRTGMLLNSKELAQFAHYPSGSIVSRKLQRETRKTKAVPSTATGHRLILGANEHEAKRTLVSLHSSLRTKHAHIIGSTGTGKSTLLLNMIVQDIEQRTGVCVLEPHGDLIEKVLTYIPEDRIKDVVLIDPADSEYPVGFNILSAQNSFENDILASDLVAAFKRLSTSWGDQMGSVMANAILAFLESSTGGNLADLRRFLVEKEYRAAILRTVTDPSILYYWKHEYPLLKTNSIGSILTRLDSFLRPKLIRNMVCQEKSLDFGKLMDEGKIVLVKLSQGLIGAENSFLLGTFIVSKLQQAAMARQATDQANRKDFFLYVDEFHHFVTPSMCSILSGTRKYNFGLVLAHQTLTQIPDSELTDLVLAAGTRICFRLTETDAKKLSPGFAAFEPADLQNLATGEAIARIETPEQDFSLQTIPLQPPDIATEVQEQIIAYSRSRYGTHRQEVEEALIKKLGITTEEPKPEPKKPAAPVEPVQKEPEKAPPTITEQPTPILPVAQEKESEILVKPKEEKKLPDFLKEPEIREVKVITDTPQGIEYLQQAEKRRHTDLKNRIRREAGFRQFIATTEQATADRKGYVDVSLVRNSYKIAVEVSVTTTATWELHNVQKCLADNYNLVVVCSDDTKQLEKIRAVIHTSLSETEQAKVMVCLPEVFFEHLDSVAQEESSTKQKMKGWNVKKVVQAVTPEELELNKKIVKRVLKKPPKPDKE